MGSPATMSEKKKEELFGGTTADAVDTVDAVALTGSAEWTDRSCFENGAPLEATLDPTEYKKLERRARFKMDVQVVPLCLLLYLLSFLDRTNIAQAVLDGDAASGQSTKNPGLMTSLGLTPHDYAVALTVLYPTYIALEVPSNLLIKRLGPRIWIPGLVILWGIVETLQGLVSSRTGLYINRIFLGATEAGILPGIAVYLTFFYTPNELQFRQAFFFTGASLSGAFSGLLAAAIRKMDGIAGQHGWQWIFYLEGIFTVLVGVACIFLMPNEAESCFLLTNTEKQLVRERLNRANDRFRDRHELAAKLEKCECTTGVEDAPQPVPAPWHRDVMRAFTDMRLILTCVLGFCSALSVYSIAYFSPTIVKNMGEYSTIQAMLMSCPPFAVSFAYSILMAIVSDRLRQRYVTIIAGLGLCTIGLAVVLGCKESMTRYGGIILMTSGSFSVPPALFTWLANNASGHYKRATGLALLIVFTNCSGLTSSWLFNTKTESPDFTRGISTNLAIAALGMVISTAIELSILYERKQRQAGRRDERVVSLYQKTGWSNDHMRLYMGDDHPDYHLEL